MRANQKNDYAVWKAIITNGLQDSTTKAIKKQQLKHLTQKSDERVRDFQRRLEDNYKIAYGATAARSVEPTVVQMRDELKKEIFLKGLRKDIQTAVYSRINTEEIYENVVAIAIDCEKLVELRRLSEKDDITSTVTKMTRENEKNSEDIKELTELVHTLIKTKISPTVAGIDTVDDTGLIAAINQYHNSKTNYPNIKDKPQVRFNTNRGRSNSRYNSNNYQGNNYRETRRCYNCNRVGHIARQCRSRPSNQNYRQRSKSRDSKTRQGERNNNTN